jgi:hypothetical protein
LTVGDADTAHRADRLVLREHAAHSSGYDPTTRPHIFVGPKIAITFAVIGGVIEEFVGSEDGTAI